MKMVDEKSWEEFRETGLFLIVNSILHIFGWAIVCEVRFENCEERVTRVFPARVKYRGFDSESASEAYRKISKFMVDNAEELKDEADLK